MAMVRKQSYLSRHFIKLDYLPCNVIKLKPNNDEIACQTRVVESEEFFPIPTAPF